VLDLLGATAAMETAPSVKPLALYYRIKTYLQNY
jgi:hypothetical protein